MLLPFLPLFGRHCCGFLGDQWTEALLHLGEDRVHIPVTFGVDPADHFRTVVEADLMTEGRDDLTVEPAGFRTCQVDHRRRDVLWRELLHPLWIGIRNGADHAGVGDWRDAVRCHSVLAQSVGARVGEADDRHLGRRVIRLSRGAVQTRAGGEVDDPPVRALALAAPVDRSVLGGVERASGMDGQDRVPVLLG